MRPHPFIAFFCGLLLVIGSDVAWAAGLPRIGDIAKTPQGRAKVAEIAAKGELTRAEYDFLMDAVSYDVNLREPLFEEARARLEADLRAGNADAYGAVALRFHKPFEYRFRIGTSAQATAAARLFVAVPEAVTAAEWKVLDRRGGDYPKDSNRPLPPSQKIGSDDELRRALARDGYESPGPIQRDAKDRTRSIRFEDGSTQTFTRDFRGQVVAVEIHEAPTGNRPAKTTILERIPNRDGGRGPGDAWRVASSRDELATTALRWYGDIRTEANYVTLETPQETRTLLPDGRAIVLDPAYKVRRVEDGRGRLIGVQTELEPYAPSVHDEVRLEHDEKGLVEATFAGSRPLTRTQDGRWKLPSGAIVAGEVSYGRTAVMVKEALDSQGAQRIHVLAYDNRPVDENAAYVRVYADFVPKGTKAPKEFTPKTSTRSFTLSAADRRYLDLKRSELAEKGVTANAVSDETMIEFLDHVERTRLRHLEHELFTLRVGITAGVGHKKNPHLVETVRAIDELTSELGKRRRLLANGRFGALDDVSSLTSRLDRIQSELKAYRKEGPTFGEAFDNFAYGFAERAKATVTDWKFYVTIVACANPELGPYCLGVFVIGEGYQLTMATITIVDGYQSDDPGKVNQGFQMVGGATFDLALVGGFMAAGRAFRFATAEAPGSGPVVGRGVGIASESVAMELSLAPGAPRMTPTVPRGELFPVGRRVQVTRSSGAVENDWVISEVLAEGVKVRSPDGRSAKLVEPQALLRNNLDLFVGRQVKAPGPNGIEDGWVVERVGANGAVHLVKPGGGALELPPMLVSGLVRANARVPSAAPAPVGRVPEVPKGEARAVTDEYLAKHRVEGRIPDGFVDGGRRLQLDAPEPFETGGREVLVVDRARDVRLQEHLRVATELGEGVRSGRMTETEALQELGRYVDTMMTPENGVRMSSNNAWAQANAGREVLIGDNLCAGGVCRHRSLMFKVLGDQMTLTSGRGQVALVRGNMVTSSGRGGHAWNEVTLSTGERVIVDVMNPEPGFGRFPTTSEVAKSYLSVNDTPLYQSAPTPPPVAPPVGPGASPATSPLARPGRLGAPFVPLEPRSDRGRQGLASPPTACDLPVAPPGP